MTNSINGLDSAQELLMKLVEQSPDDWEIRKKVVKVLFDSGFYRDASKMVWNAPEIPSVNSEIIFAARIVSKGQPSRAMRLFDTVIEKNRSNPEENLSMAKLLVIAGMPYQAIRFYGAATGVDSKLMDEKFEMCLIAADAEGRNWSETVSTDKFPWDGPELEQDVEEVISPEEAKDAYANLLSGATQPVPMRAPARKKVERSNELPHWEAKKGKTSNLSTGVVSEERKVSQKKSPKPAPQPIVQQESPLQQTPVAKAPAPGGEKVASNKILGITPIITQALARANSEEAAQYQQSPQSAFFKSYDDAHENKSSVSEKVKPSSYVAPTVPSVAVQEDLKSKKNDTPLPALSVNAQVQAVEVSNDFQAPEVSENKEKEGIAGLFASFLNKIRGNSNEPLVEERINVEDLDLSAVEKIAPQAQAASAKKAIPAKQPQPVASTPVAKQNPAESPVVSRPMVRVAREEKKVESDRPSVPKELDGRTQLVALAPENGSEFFDALRKRYANIPVGNTPKPVAVARDMANVDYLVLLNEACSKNLDAFSKLLGLHRVMSASGCSEWVDDINLLRKGYGDAVLATVVSKYSVEECREILNSVYSSPTPAPQAAAI